MQEGLVSSCQMGWGCPLIWELRSDCRMHDYADCAWCKQCILNRIGGRIHFPCSLFHETLRPSWAFVPVPFSRLSLQKAGVLNVKFNCDVLYAVGPVPSDKKHQNLFLLFGGSGWVCELSGVLVTLSWVLKSHILTTSGTLFPLWPSKASAEEIQLPGKIKTWHLPVLDLRHFVSTYSSTHPPSPPHTHTHMHAHTVSLYRNIHWWSW